MPSAALSGSCAALRPRITSLTRRRTGGEVCAVQHTSSFTSRAGAVLFRSSDCGADNRARGEGGWGRAHGRGGARRVAVRGGCCPGLQAEQGRGRFRRFARLWCTALADRGEQVAGCGRRTSGATGKGQVGVWGQVVL